MGRFGDHAEVCCCGGDRVVRHNAIRDGCFHELKAGLISVEREKAGLLPVRSPDEGLPGSAQGRRPADLFITRTAAPLAVDFAVASGIQQSLLASPTWDESAFIQNCEDWKIAYKDTGQQCAAQSIAFLPAIVEAHGGGMSLKLRQLFSQLAKEAAPALNRDPEAVSLRIAQRISCSLRREIARAVFHRRGHTLTEGADAGWDAVPESLREAGMP